LKRARALMRIPLGHRVFLTGMSLILRLAGGVIVATSSEASSEINFSAALRGGAPSRGAPAGSLQRAAPALAAPAPAAAHRVSSTARPAASSASRFCTERRTSKVGSSPCATARS